MGERVKMLIEMARDSMTARLKDITRQDKSQGEKQRGIFEAKLSAIVTAIEKMPPSSYDKSLTKRVTKLV